MTARNIFKHVMMYQRARQKFCQTIAELATKPENIPLLDSEGIVDLLLPLTSDPELSVRINSACCVSRLANNSKKLAIQFVMQGVPQNLLKELLLERNDNIQYKRIVIQGLKGMMRHSPELAEQIMEWGGLSAFLVCLEDPDIFLKEAAVCGIGCIIKQSGELASVAISQGVLTLLVNCIQHHELSLRKVATCAISDIAIHSPGHATAVVDAAALRYIMKCLDNLDAKLKQYALMVLANIATHDSNLAEEVIAVDIFPKVLFYLKHENSMVRKHSAILIQNIVKHNLELAQLVVNTGGIGALIEVLLNSQELCDDVLTHAAFAIGFISGQSPHFALAVIECKGVDALASILNTRITSEYNLIACIWALGNTGKHTPEHCNALARLNVLSRLMEIYDMNTSSDELKTKAKCTLKLTLKCCLDLPSLESLLYRAPMEILKYVLAQFSKILPNDPSARRLFTTSGGLKKVQEIAAEKGTELADYIKVINSCFPDDIVKLYAPGFSDSILERIDLYKPKNIPEVIRKPSTSSDMCNDFFEQK